MADRAASALDYDLMPAGKEIDILVAERVMGWEVVQNHGDATRTPYALDCGRYLVAVDRIRYGSEEPFSPSTDLAAAWLLLDKLNHQGSWLFVLCQPHSGNQPTVLALESGARPFPPIQIFERLAGEMHTARQLGRPVILTGGETMPLAICRAALKAVATR